MPQGIIINSQLALFQLHSKTWTLMKESTIPANQKLYSGQTRVHHTQVSNFGYITQPDFTNCKQ